MEEDEPSSEEEDDPSPLDEVLQSTDLLMHLFDSLGLRAALSLSAVCRAWQDAAAAKRQEWAILVPEARVGRRGDAIARIKIGAIEKIEGTDPESDGEEGAIGVVEEVEGGAVAAAEEGDGPAMLSPTYAIFLPSGGLVVSDSRNGRLQLLSDSGEPCEMLGTGHDELCFPTGLASSPDGDVLYVADRSTCRLLKLSATSGELLASSLHGELQNPDGIAQVGGNLYVADTNNHRVACFTTDLVLRFAFGSHGTALGRLRHPNGVAGHSGSEQEYLAGGGELFVADSDNDRVQVFTLAGRPLRAIGSSGAAPGQFRAPCGVALCAGLLLVSEWVGRRLQVLTPLGEPLQVLTPPGASELAGLAVCHNGARVAAVDFAQCQLQLLRLAAAARDRCAARAVAAAQAAAPPDERRLSAAGSLEKGVIGNVRTSFSREDIVMSAQL